MKEGKPEMDGNLLLHPELYEKGKDQIDINFAHTVRWKKWKVVMECIFFHTPVRNQRTAQTVYKNKGLT